MPKILTDQEHNKKINDKIKEHQAKIDELKLELRSIPVPQQASLAYCNSIQRPKLKPQAQAVKIKAPQVVQSTPELNL